MEHEKYAVMFDTNSYRNLVSDIPPEQVKAYIAGIRKEETAKNIVARATTTVGMEMLANLAGPGKGLHYEDCLKGLIAMTNHSGDEEQMTIYFIPHPYHHIALNFFRKDPPAIELQGKNMAGIIADFIDEYMKAAEYHQTGGTFQALQQYIQWEEARWVEDILQLVEHVRREALKADPSSKGKRLCKKMLEYIDSGLVVPFVSMAIVPGVAQMLGIRMTGVEHTGKGYILPQMFPFSVAFYQWVCHRIVAENIDMHSKRSKARRWNWRWDYEVPFLINDLPISDRQLLLVTADRDMTKILKEYGYEAKVKDLRGYLDFLESDYS